MYKSLIAKSLRILSYVTIILLSSISHAQEIPESREERKKLAVKLVKDLGADSYKIRRAAIQGLTKLGYYARAEVEALLNSNDPEIKENAKTVWDNIRWAVTENNPEMVSEFIKKFKEGKAINKDWVKLVETCGVESIEVILELAKNSDQLKERAIKEDVVRGDQLDPFQVQEVNPFIDARKFDINTMLPVVLFNTKSDDIKTALQNYSEDKKETLKTVLIDTSNQSGPFIQSEVISLLAHAYSVQDAWDHYQNCDVTSKLIRSRMPSSVLSHLKKNYKSFRPEAKLRACLVLYEQKQLDLPEISEVIEAKDFHNCDNETQKVFYDVIGSKMSLEKIQSLLQNGSEPWHKYKFMSLKKTPDKDVIIEAFKNVFNKGGDIVEFIEHNFPVDSIKAIPFYLIASQMESRDDEWFLYSTSFNLLRYSQRIGAYRDAVKYLKMFNDENRRVQDTNEAFYNTQEKLIKKETQDLLKKVQFLHKEPKNALELLLKAEELNPQLLTVKIQKMETLVKLNKIEEAKSILAKTVKTVPDNLLEIRDLIHICWELNDKKSAGTLIKKLALGEDDFSNVALASSNFEFFLDMDKMLKEQNKIRLRNFGRARQKFYESNYKEVPDLCLNPEEGDFQYIWGAMSLAFDDKKQASSYFSKRIFDEHWPETLALATIGKISPDEIINEAKSVLSLVERKGRLTEAYYFAGCVYLAEKNKDKARELFQKAVDLQFYDYYEYIAAGVMLKKLN